MRERGGRVRGMVIKNTTTAIIQKEIRENVEKGATIYTDEHSANLPLAEDYTHRSVNHGVGEYVNGPVHTNGIESVWGIMKCGYKGAYKQWSPKHLTRYLNEFSFRLHEGSQAVHIVERINRVVRSSVGKRLTYEELTRGGPAYPKREQQRDK